MNLSAPDVERIVCEAIKQLLERDSFLLANNVSERAITHKLAEYLQALVPELNVDCEYNRDVTQGADARKVLRMLKESRSHQIALLDREDWNEDELLEISTYPDVIAHRRGANSQNWLIIEVKKQHFGSKRRPETDHDHLKLRLFTAQTGLNPYRYRYGLFVVFQTGYEVAQWPELTWFVNGVAGELVELQPYEPEEEEEDSSNECGDGEVGGIMEG